ncbi:uncharacterized protein BJ171DRAFT_514056 [Polychytrium aggregatum]|uniref:uncharacterized protein n=1 Tax=Polychytrium aggregatum TaxID=110093 RepID=UPI0022FE6217|nr:uncharacterized protein BJ171DRAFT_514056 [Polychytrium aggregatum]KAI9202436.1 hypothetical protein BJ171DRAFT_514056 [Polychytrium aggregatum]
MRMKNKLLNNLTMESARLTGMGGDSGSDIDEASEDGGESQTTSAEAKPARGGRLSLHGIRIGSRGRIMVPVVGDSDAEEEEMSDTYTELPRLSLTALGGLSSLPQPSLSTRPSTSTALPSRFRRTESTRSTQSQTQTQAQVQARMQTGGRRGSYFVNQSLMPLAMRKLMNRNSSLSDSGGALTPGQPPPPPTIKALSPDGLPDDRYSHDSFRSAASLLIDGFEYPLGSALGSTLGSTLFHEGFQSIDLPMPPLTGGPHARSDQSLEKRPLYPSAMPAGPDGVKTEQPEDGAEAGTKRTVVIVPGRGTHRSLSHVFRRKDIYMQLCFIFGIVLLGVAINDYIYIFVLETPPYTTRWLISFMVLHVFSFFTFLLAFIYGNESGDILSTRMALGGGVINLLAFTMEAVLRIGFQGYFPNSTTYSD